jgi:hypothetical protein
MKTFAILILALANSTSAFAQQRSQFDTWDKDKDGKLVQTRIHQGRWPRTRLEKTPRAIPVDRTDSRPLGWIEYRISNTELDGRSIDLPEAV